MAGGYGAVAAKNPDDENSFEEYENNADYRYIQERPLTLQERVRKYVSAGMPILVAIVLMLGFGWWTTNALTPRHGTGIHTAVPAQSFTIETFPTLHPTAAPVVETSSSSEASSSKTTKSRSSSVACADNPTCKKLGLIGDCCPTADEVQLGCCL